MPPFRRKRSTGSKAAGVSGITAYANKMSLGEEIQALARVAGADHFGIADLTPALDSVRRQGGDAAAEYPRAVSIGINLIHPIVDLLPSREESLPDIYRCHGTEIINIRLDLLVSEIAGKIQQSGYGAFPVPASKRIDNTRISAFFSHKLAAHCAGLGWIGKSCLLITPGAGPRVRWGSVLTNAPLPVTGTPMDEQCGSCTTCVDICPVQAFSGEPFRQNDPLEIRFDAGKCDQYFRTLQADGKEAVCGLCLYSCPFGKKASENLQKHDTG